MFGEELRRDGSKRKRTQRTEKRYRDSDKRCSFAFQAAINHWRVEYHRYIRQFPCPKNEINNLPYPFALASLAAYHRNLRLAAIFHEISFH